jgi:hydroxymethylbilane synthase
VQLRRLRPDLTIIDLRGNVDTRLRKLDEGQYDAIILAAAGLKRLDRGDRIAGYLPFLPAAGQGAIAVQIREGDERTAGLLRHIHDEATALAVQTERSWLAAMDGGCQVPMGALAEIQDGRVSLRAFAGDPHGDGYLEEADVDTPDQATVLGQRVAERLLKAGASAWIEPPTARDPSIA